MWDERLVDADGIVAVVQHHKSAQDLCTLKTKMTNFVLYIFHWKNFVSIVKRLFQKRKRCAQIICEFYAFSNAVLSICEV